MNQTRWYVLDQSTNPPEPNGPFDRAAIEGMIRRSEVTAVSSVARVGSETWSPAGEDPELRPMFHAGIEDRTAPPVSAQVVTLDDELRLPADGLSIGTAFALGWRVFKKGYVHLLLCGLILLGCSIPLGIPAFLGGLMLQEGQRTGDSEVEMLGMSLQWFGNGLNLILWPAFAPILAWPAVTVLRGEARLGDVFTGFRRYLPLLGTGLLWTVIVFAGAVAFFLVIFIISFLGGLFAGLLGRNNEAVLVGVIVVMAIPAVVVLVSGFAYLFRAIAASTFSYILLVDPRESVRAGLEAVGEGWRMASMKHWRPTVIMLLAGLLAAASILLLCAGYVFLGLPLYIAVMGATYELARRDLAEASAARTVVRMD